MKSQLPTSFTHFPKYAIKDVIYACAWCPKKTYQKLAKNQEYSHGICVIHKEQLILQIKNRQVKFRA